MLRTKHSTAHDSTACQGLISHKTGIAAIVGSAQAVHHLATATFFVSMHQSSQMPSSLAPHRHPHTHTLLVRRSNSFTSPLSYPASTQRSSSLCELPNATHQQSLRREHNTAAHTNAVSCCVHTSYCHPQPCGSHAGLLLCAACGVLSTTAARDSLLANCFPPPPPTTHLMLLLSAGSKAATGASSCRTSHTRTQPSPPHVTSSGGPYPRACVYIKSSTQSRHVKLWLFRDSMQLEFCCAWLTCFVPATASDTHNHNHAPGPQSHLCC